MRTRVAVTTRVHLAAASEVVWACIGDFGGIAGWMPGVLDVELRGVGPGALRFCRTVIGEFVERLEAQDSRSHAYSIVSGPFPLADYLACLSVQPMGGSECEVCWASSAELPVSMIHAEAEEHLRRLQIVGLRALQKRFRSAGPW